MATPAQNPKASTSCSSGGRAKYACSPAEQSNLISFAASASTRGVMRRLYGARERIPPACLGNVWALFIKYQWRRHTTTRPVHSAPQTVSLPVSWIASLAPPIATPKSPVLSWNAWLGTSQLESQRSAMVKVTSVLAPGARATFSNLRGPCCHYASLRSILYGGSIKGQRMAAQNERRPSSRSTLEAA
jgi:hypothetical protein